MKRANKMSQPPEPITDIFFQNCSSYIIVICVFERRWRFSSCDSVELKQSWKNWMLIVVDLHKISVFSYVIQNQRIELNKYYVIHLIFP